MYTPPFPPAFSHVDALNMQRVRVIKSQGFRDALFKVNINIVAFPNKLEREIYMRGVEEAKKLIEKYNLNICHKENT